MTSRGAYYRNIDIGRVTITVKKEEAERLSELLGDLAYGKQFYEGWSLTSQFPAVPRKVLREQSEKYSVLGPVWWRRVAVEMVDTSEENQVF
ncbi:MAG TPA: hypothetical protein VF026_24580 [Ktedonobacteraceae bacterium]